MIHWRWQLQNMALTPSSGAAEHGADSVINDEDVVSITVAVASRRPTFLQKA